MPVVVMLSDYCTRRMQKRRACEEKKTLSTAEAALHR